MRKILIYAVLAANVVFVSCMEKERRNTYDYNKTVPVFITQPNSLITSHTTNNLYSWQPPICTANQPEWQQLNAIANLTYNNHQSTVMDEVELKPIYRPAPTNTAQKEQKPLLQTNALQSDETIIQSLYDKACKVASDSKQRINTKKYYEELIALITDIHNAKNNGIHEDSLTMRAYKNNNMDLAMFFSYLKQYNQYKETLPHINDLVTTRTIPLIKNKLACILDIPSPHNTTTTTQHIVSFGKKYLALEHLLLCIRSSHTGTDIPAFFSYIYSNTKNPQNDYVGLSYDELKNKFYELAYDVVTSYNYLAPYRQKIDDYPYDLLKIIEAGATLNPQKQEDDFCHDIIKKELTITERFTSSISPVLKICDNIPHIKKCIGLIFPLIKKYNQNRQAKLTPTKEQMSAYRNNNSFFSIALPDSFDNTLFDKKIYAFAELGKLFDNISCLIETGRSHQEAIDECFEYLYNKNSTKQS